jgi:molybdopterin molybdotransferase
MRETTPPCEPRLTLSTLIPAFDEYNGSQALFFRSGRLYLRRGSPTIGVNSNEMAAWVQPSGSLSFEEARRIVEDRASRLRATGTEDVEILDSAGRVLAEVISADRPFPPFRRAARDGYAVQASDLKQLPARLRVIGEIKAGAESSIEVGPGEAAAIMTGAAAPFGANAVVMIEHTNRLGDEIEVDRTVDAGANIVPTGSEAHLGEQLLMPGIVIDHAAIAVAASVGKSIVKVFHRPRVAILATGDEIVTINVLPGKNQIRNSNSYSIAAQVSAACGDPIFLPVAPDEPLRLRELILQGLQADLLLLAGGVSMGKYDLVEQVLAELGAQFDFTSVAIQPGKPAVFGSLQWGANSVVRGESKHFFGLPGNPVSTMVTFELFAKPIVEALAGMTPKKLVFLRAKLKSTIKTKTGLKRFLPAALSGEFEQAEVQLVRWQGSGDIAATARANCYVVVPPERDQIPQGEWVPVLMR